MKKKALVILAEGFEEMEAVISIDILRRAGIEVITAVLANGLLVRGSRNIYIKADKKLFRVLLDDIYYLEAYGDYVKVHTADRMLLTKKKLSNMINELPEKQFSQVHRSFVIALNHIDFLEGNMVNIDGHKIPVSAGHRDNLLTALNKK